MNILGGMNVKRLSVLLVVLVFALTIFVTPALASGKYAAVSSSDNEVLKFDIELKTGKDFGGFFAYFDENGKIRLEKFDDPKKMASRLGRPIDEILQKSRVNSKDSQIITPMGTHKSRIEAYAVIEDSAGIKMNELWLDHTYLYDFSNILQRGILEADAAARTSGPGAWENPDGPYKDWVYPSSSSDYPITSEGGKAWAEYQNNEWFNPPYHNKITINTSAEGDSDGWAGFSFDIDEKASDWLWGWWGTYNVVDIY